MIITKEKEEKKQGRSKNKSKKGKEKLDEGNEFPKMILEETKVDRFEAVKDQEKPLSSREIIMFVMFVIFFIVVLYF